MDFISTKELAGRWQVDPSRVVRLAKAGRIPGAKLVGHSWLFPADTERLPDERRREHKAAPERQPFRFPLYFYCGYTEEELAQFTEDERTLYEAEQTYLQGGFDGCCAVLTPLNEKTADPVVRLGALYVLTMSHIFMKQFRQAAADFQEMSLLLEQELPHRQVLRLIYHDLESYFTGNSFYIDSFSIDLQENCLPKLRDYLLLETAFSDVMQVNFKDIPVNPLPYELFCRTEEGGMTPITAALLHLYIALMWRTTGQTEKAAGHVANACRIAEENGIERMICFADRYIPDSFRLALQDSHPEQLRRLERLADEETEVFRKLHGSLQKHNILHRLDADSIKYVSFAEQGMTNKEIAAALGLSANTISKKYALLFEKTGTHSKKELVRLYKEAMKAY